MGAKVNVSPCPWEGWMLQSGVCRGEGWLSTHSNPPVKLGAEPSLAIYLLKKWRASYMAGITCLPQIKETETFSLLHNKNNHGHQTAPCFLIVMLSPPPIGAVPMYSQRLGQSADVWFSTTLENSSCSCLQVLWVHIQLPLARPRNHLRCWGTPS